MYLITTSSYLLYPATTIPSSFPPRTQRRWTVLLVLLPLLRALILCHCRLKLVKALAFDGFTVKYATGDAGGSISTPPQANSTYGAGGSDGKGRPSSPSPSSSSSSDSDDASLPLLVSLNESIDGVRKSKT